MAALPFMQLYPADYLADTIHLTCEEHGAYILLILSYWQTGKPIPEDRICKIIRVGGTRCAAIKDTIREFFEVGDDGLWVHHRIEADLHRVNSRRKQASAAGKASAKKRWGSKPAPDKAPVTVVTDPLQRTSNNIDTYTYTYTYYKEQCRTVFDHWVQVMDKNAQTKLTSLRKTKVEARLKAGYTVEDIIKAIDNCSKSPHNMGENDRHTKFNDLELICRSDEKLEYFRDSVGAGEERNDARAIATNKDWH